MKTITGKEFDSEVLKSTIPTLVAFSASWCGPCIKNAQVLENVIEEMGDKAKLVKVDVDDNPELATQYRIKSIPAMIVFKDGK